MMLKRWQRLLLAFAFAATAFVIAQAGQPEMLFIAIVPAVAAIVWALLALEPTSVRTRRILDGVWPILFLGGLAPLVVSSPAAGWVTAAAYLLLGGHFISAMYRPPPKRERSRAT
jgi:hypothetical protein